MNEDAITLLRFLNSRIGASCKASRDKAVAAAEKLDRSDFTVRELVDTYVEIIRRTS